MPHQARLRALESKMHRFLAVVDLEATCCCQGTIPPDQMEIIEVGIVVLDLLNGCKAVDEFASFVRPIERPELTAFCTRLTTISQADVDTAPPWAEVSADVEKFLSRFPDATWCSWGNYDRNQIANDARRHHVGQCLPEGLHTNFKAHFSSIHVIGKQMGLKAAVGRCGLSWAGTHHRAIADARNLAAVAPYVLCRKPLPAVVEGE